MLGRSDMAGRAAKRGGGRDEDRDPRRLHRCRPWSTATGQALPADAEITVFREAIPPERLVDELFDYEIVVITQQRARFPRTVLEGLPPPEAPRVQRPDEQRRRPRGQDRAGNPALRNRRDQPRGAPARSLYRPRLRAPRGLPARRQRWRGRSSSPSRADRRRDRAHPTGGWPDRSSRSRSPERRLGLLGAGHLGGRVSRSQKALGMDVVAWSQNLTEERCADLGVTKVTKDELLSAADVLGVFLVFSERSRNTLRRKRPGQDEARGAILVNISPRSDRSRRRPSSRRCAPAASPAPGLDVFDREPLPADHPFRSLDNVVVTPHIGYVHRAPLPHRLAAPDGRRTSRRTSPDHPSASSTDPADCPPMAPQ